LIYENLYDRGATLDVSGGSGGATGGGGTNGFDGSDGNVIKCPV